MFLFNERYFCKEPTISNNVVTIDFLTIWEPTNFDEYVVIKEIKKTTSSEQKSFCFKSLKMINKKYDDQSYLTVEFEFEDCKKFLEGKGYMVEIKDYISPYE